MSSRERGSRAIVLDTETTGMSPENGDRIIEIGMVELVELMPTGKEFHALLYPERFIPQSASAVHGITDADVKDKPLFRDIAPELTAFLGDADIIAHNAPFDMAFIHAEFDRAQLPRLRNRSVDTLPLARQRVSGYVSLDALCKKFNIDLSARQKHSALLDAKLLAKVYLHLCGGPHFSLDFGGDQSLMHVPVKQAKATRQERTLGWASEDERDAHMAFGKPFLPEEALSVLRAR